MIGSTERFDRQAVFVTSQAGLAFAIWFVSCHRPSETRASAHDTATSIVGLSSPAASAPVSNVDAAPPPVSSCAATTQPGINDRAAEDAKRADADLNELLGNIRAKHGGDRVFLSRFNAAQVAWLKFREAELGSIYAHVDDSRFPYGTMFGMCINSDREIITRRRIHDLQAWLVGIPNSSCRSEYPEASPQ